MNSKVLWQVIGAILVLGILAAGWFLVVQPVLNAVAADKVELEGVEAQNELIVADIEAMNEVDLGALEAETRDYTTQVPSIFDEAAIYRELADIVSGVGAELVRVAISPPTEFLGAPSAALLPETLAPANTPEALTAAAEAGLVVATATIEFTAETHGQSLEIISRLAASKRVYLVASGDLADAATQRLVAELYFLPPEVAESTPITEQ